VIETDTKSTPDFLFASSCQPDCSLPNLLQYLSGNDELGIPAISLALLRPILEPAVNESCDYGMPATAPIPLLYRAEIPVEPG
jgi:hypothetical protein